MDWKASAMTTTNIMSTIKRVSDSQQYGSKDNTTNSNICKRVSDSQQYGSEDNTPKLKLT
jgi:hypothetical protein